METGAITGYIDVAQVLLYVFWAFFFGLIFYLQRESRREGYPLETDEGELETLGPIFGAGEKVFKLEHGPHKEVEANRRETRKNLKIKKMFVWEGAPYEPTGDPMADGVGPASWADRADVPDLTVDGKPKIVPLRSAAAKEFYPSEGDNDPRGMDVYGCDGEVAGTVSDIWIDTAEYLARYLEVKTPGEDSKTVLLPINFARISGPKNIFSQLSGIEPLSTGVFVHAITADQFKGVPKTAKSTTVTLLEEDKIMAYYGGGKLYATPERMEPLV